MMLIESPEGDRCLVDSLDGYEGWQVVGDGLPLEVRKAALVDRIKALRDTHEFGTVTTPQGLLQIDERSQGRLQRALELGRTYERLTGQPFSTEWRMFDNSEAAVGIAQLEGWSLLIGAQVQHIFSRYAELYTAVMGAPNAGELDAANIEEGWDVGAA